MSDGLPWRRTQFAFMSISHDECMKWTLFSAQLVMPPCGTRRS